MTDASSEIMEDLNILCTELAVFDYIFEEDTIDARIWDQNWDELMIHRGTDCRHSQ